MPLSQSFFEIRDVRPLQGLSWIPLREVAETTFNPPGSDIIRLEEWAGTATAAIEDTHRPAAEQLGWSNGIGIDPHRSGVESWGYCSVEIFRDWQNPLGINLAIDQHVEQESSHVWHLHPDLVVALHLVREKDSWFRPEEGWVEVVRLKRDNLGQPRLMEIKAEFLRDYLSARSMSLYCSSYRERIMVSAFKPSFSWKDDQFEEIAGRDRLEGIVTSATYPEVTGHFWTRGAIWRTEWVEAGTHSSRVRGDPDPHTTTFALENNGSRVTANQLGNSIHWLYFEPTLVPALLRHRSGRLRWATSETGSLGATNYGVHFGINDLGLITVFAKDIGNLQPWEQRLWSAHNVTPDGGVSRELFAAQMEVNPAATVAPEKELADAMSELDAAFLAMSGAPLLRDHESVPALLKRAHRFIASDAEGLLELAKELTKLFMERVDVAAIAQAIGLSTSKTTAGSLKSLEKLVEHHRSKKEATAMMAPLFGIYDLRLADAHLGSSKIASAKLRIGVVDAEPAVMQGRQLIARFNDTLRQIGATLT